MSKYRHLEFSADSPAPTDKEIAAIESVLGARLPHDFRAFLRAANGARLNYWIPVQTADGEEWECFCNTLSTVGDGDDTFLGELEALKVMRNLPFRVLPFASADGGRSYVFLDLRSEVGGAVLASLSPKSPLLRIADSFSDYIERLESDSDLFDS